MQDDETNESNSLKIAFVTYDTFGDDKALRGGILLIDGFGKPLEFRCTSPIRPNALQKTLYGESLLPYIAVELISLPLIKNLREKPLLIFVEKEEFIGLREKHKEPIPLFLIRAQGEDFVRASGEDDSANQHLVDNSEKGVGAIVTQPANGYENDYRENSAIIQKISSRSNLLEPFQRIRNALETVHEKKIMENRS